jgi:photosystem II stability/assembly factor-like uncharacterized protein
MRFQRLSTLALALLLALATAARAQTPPWTPIGPFGGYIASITPDPVHSGVLYAVTTQGVYRTADAGASWRLIYPGLLSGGRITIDPLHPSTLYLTGAYRDRVVLKSVDSGAHWAPADAGLPPFYSTLAVDPARPRRLYVGTPGAGFWRSVDAGASWQQVGDGILPSYIQAVAASRPSGRVLAGTSRGLYRSIDGGSTWTPAAGTPQTYAYAVAFAPSDPRIAYAYFERSNQPNTGGLYRSTDGGVSWRRVLKAQPSSAAEISISPVSPRLVYVLFADRVVFRSTNGGDRWTQLPAPPMTAMAADPFSVQTVYSSLLTGLGLGGFWRSGNQGVTWTQRSQGMTGIQASSLAIDPSAPDHLWTTTPTTPLRTTNGGASWVGGRTPAGENGMLQVAAGPGGAIYALTYKNSSDHSSLPFYSLWKTTNDGASWTRLLGPSAALYGFRLAPSDPRTLYVLESLGGVTGSAHSLWRSTDGGAHWVNQPVTALTCGLGDLAVAPSNAAVIYLGGCKDEHVSALLRSTDGGNTFTDVSAGLTGPHVQALAVDPRDPNTLWAGTGYPFLDEPGDGVWKSTDGGSHWIRAGDELAGLTITALLAPDVPGRVYAAIADGRIFRSDDGGATWDDWTDGLPPGRIFALQAAPDDPRRIYAVTVHGIWLLTESD